MNAITAGRWRRRARHALLLPLALLFVVLEGVVWRGAHALLRPLDTLPALAATRATLARLSGWAALPLFLVPEAVARVGELWTAVLLLHRHMVAAAMVYLLVRVLATLVAVFIWNACEPALLRLRWFGRAVGWLAVVRRWAHGHIAPLRDWTQRLRVAGARRRVDARR